MLDSPLMLLRDGRTVQAGAVNPLIVADVNHFRNHEGRAFEASCLIPTATPVAAGAVVDFIVTTDGEVPHAEFSIDAQGSFEFELFEAPTVTPATGTVIPVVCRNFSVNSATLMTAVLNPAITAAGTSKRSGLVAAGQGNKSGGGGSNFAHEIILKLATTYLLRLKNVSGAAQALGITFQCYI